MDAVKTIGGMALTMGALDAGWLTFRYAYHQNLFKTVQGSVLQVRWIPALLIYILMPSALYIWAKGTTVREAAVKGALVGFILYAFYDLTNYATLQGWTLEMTITDVLWGALLCTAGATAGYVIQNYVNH
jgi:uncharacterized membrane protein